MSECKAIAQKLIALMREVGYVQKDKSNAFHGYRYASDEAVLAHIHAAAVKVGVAFVPAFSIESVGVISGKGGESQYVTVRVMVNVIDADTGESVQTVGIGSGMDKGDKAVMKAETAAMKYALLKLLLIPTGDDPEADRSTDESTDEARTQPAQATQPQPARGKADSQRKAAMNELKLAMTAADKLGLDSKLIAQQGANRSSMRGASLEEICAAIDELKVAIMAKDGPTTPPPDPPTPEEMAQMAPVSAFPKGATADSTVDELAEAADREMTPPLDGPMYMVKSAHDKTGTSAKGTEWTKHSFIFASIDGGEDKKANTFSATLAAVGHQAHEQGYPVRIELEPSDNPRWWPTLIRIEAAEEGPPLTSDEVPF